MASNDGESRSTEQDPGKIREQLDRILSSPEFQAHDRGRRFLQYVVLETLEGRRDQLGAHAIAQAVFGRGVEFDAQSDPVVRIEAGRIRRALERYYLICGSNDPVKITIPKGHYAPSFERCARDGERSMFPAEIRNTVKRIRRGEGRLTARDLLMPVGVPAVCAALAMLALIRPLEHYLAQPPARSVASDPQRKTRIVVEPLTTLGGMPNGTDIARGLGNELISRLAKVEGLIVLAPQVSVATLPSGAMFSLQGNVTTEKAILHVQLRMIRSADGRVVWAKRFDRKTVGRNLLDLQDEIGAEIVKDISAIDDVTRLRHAKGRIE